MVAELHSFVAGIDQDYDAVLAALTQLHSSGVVEGHVNRIKMLKRQMYGGRTSTCCAPEYSNRCDAAHDHRFGDAPSAKHGM